MITIIIALTSLYLVYFDIRYKRVPNIVNLLLFTSVIISKVFNGEPLLISLASGLIAFGTFLLIHLVSRGKLGMGDCKYTAIIAVNFGYYFWLQSIIYTSLIALIVSVILLISKKIDRETPIPFIPFLVAGWMLNYYIPVAYL